MIEKLKARFISGVFWTTAENLILLILGIVQLSITSRILTPDDFGIYAIALFFYGIGRIAFSMGFGPALIQKKGDISSYLNTAWFAGIGVALIAVLLLVCIVPFCSSYFFHNTEAILPSIVVLIGALFATTANPSIVYLQREIKLKKLFILNSIPKTFSFVVAIYVVIVYKSFWGLIFATISEYFFRTLLSYIIYPTTLKCEFNKKCFKELYAFGGWLQLKNIASWLAGNIDIAIVGNLLGTSKLGFYNRAQSIAGYPRTFLDGAINSVVFPIYSKISDDNSRLNSVVNQIQDSILTIMSWLLVIIILYSKDIINLVLGSQWLEMTTVFKVLIIAYILQALVFSFNPVLRSLGKTKQEFLFYIISISAMIALLYPCCYYFDLLGAGLGILGSVLIAFPIYLHIISRHCHIKMIHFIGACIVSTAIVIITIFMHSLLISSFDFNAIIDSILTSILFVGISILSTIIKASPINSLIKILLKKDTYA